MTIKDINEIIKVICPNDEDYEKPIISPKYLRQELEQLALEQEHRHLDQEPTTKNDSPHCQHTDEEIAKSFIEDVEAVKDQLPCGQMMDFPNTFDEFVKDYGFRDKQEIYTNGSELIPVFRVKQWLEHIATTKNNLGVDREDAVERLNAIKQLIGYDKDSEIVKATQKSLDMAIKALEQEPKTGHWIETHDDWGNGIITDRKYKCSVCHGKHIDSEMGEWHEVFDYKYPFCPNCGAKMAETENT